jgi:hypothetical protein
MLNAFLLTGQRTHRMKKSIPVRKSARRTFRPRLEALEARLTLSAYTVSNLADSSPGSLRAAITSVNGDSTADVIDFSVAGVIQLTSGPLPVITNTVNIDGTSAPGFTSAPVVEIDNNGFAGLTVSGFACRLASLSIVNADGPGVTLDSGWLGPGAGNDTVVGNYIGLALDGSVAANTGVGLLIDNSIGNTIGGPAAADRNVISGNGAGGIQVGTSGQSGLAANILGNFIGTGPTGQAAAANQGNGITIYTGLNRFSTGWTTIGGTDSGAGNTIAFNSHYGVVVDTGHGNIISGNSIFQNGTGGIDLRNAGNLNIPAPQLTYAVESPGSATGFVQVQVGGIVNKPAGGTVEVFATLNGVPAGQGQIFLGSVEVTTNSAGFGTFALRNASVPAGAGTTFTATVTAGVTVGTSAFSNSIGTSTANQAYVANNYQLLLSRVPDPSSSVWVDLLDKGTSAASVVLGIEGSEEYIRDQVDAMYLRYLRRAADPQGQQHWVGVVQAGGTFEQAAEGLASSQEYYVLRGGTNQGFLTGLYADVLNRSASTAELAVWETALDSGASRANVAVAFLTSQEYRTDLVQNDYATFVLRAADADGLAHWVNALNAGATDQAVLAAIFGSPEGYQLWS